jgi:hypothetical protein
MPLHASVRVGDVYAPRRADRGTVMLSGSVAAIVTPRGLPTYSSRTEQATFRFSEGLSSAREPLPDTAPQPALPAMGLSGACDAILAGVPTCAGECRFVRVIRVLDPPGAGRVLLLCWPPQPVSQRACASDQACLPAARRPAAAGDRLGPPSVQLPLRPGRE